jgi:hypothetical protein
MTQLYRIALQLQLKSDATLHAGSGKQTAFTSVRPALRLASCFILVSDGQQGGPASGIVHCFNLTLPNPVLHGTTNSASQSHGPTTPFLKFLQVAQTILQYLQCTGMSATALNCRAAVQNSTCPATLVSTTSIPPRTISSEHQALQLRAASRMHHAEQIAKLVRWCMA